MRSAILRLAGTALVLSALAIWWGPAYRHWLAMCATTALWIVGVRLDLRQVDVLAPLDIAFFVAIALSLPRYSTAARCWRLTVGVLSCVGIELVTILGFISLDLASLPPGLVDKLAALRGSVMAMVAWATPALLTPILFRAAARNCLERRHARAGTGRRLKRDKSSASGWPMGSAARDRKTCRR